MTIEPKPRPSEDHRLTINEVAAITRTSPATVRYWRHLGRGPKAERIGRRVLFRQSDVDSWLEEQSTSDELSRGRNA